MSDNLYLERNRNSRRRRQGLTNAVSYIVLIGILIILLCIAGYLYLRNRNLVSQNTSSPKVQTGVPGGQEDPGASGLLAGGATGASRNNDARGSAAGQSAQDTNSEAAENDKLNMVLQQAALLAAGYDYDGAIDVLNGSEFASSEQAQAAVAGYEQIKTTLVRQDPKKITHIFFHSLVMDTSKAFDGDSREKGYNQVMTTKDEFMKILQSMYDRGFVLVRLHDMAYETTAEDGSKKFVGGDIMLPPGKQAFVMSQDDVCYYEYMKGDGFATKMVIGEDGRPACEMPLDDGTVATGSYDLVPILDDFVEEHPDFSYKGARAVIAFTGYNGILGYRTAASYNTDEYREKNPGFDYIKEQEEAMKVAQCLKDSGFELASHSWGHRNMGEISMDHFITDTDRWEAEVESLIGPCDTILFPFGSDVGDWREYTPDNERFRYLHDKGFRYFCNVDSSQYWVQINAEGDYMRQGRRNLDGFRMYYDLPETQPTKDHLSDLFNVSEVFDRSRPTPVPPMSE